MAFYYVEDTLYKLTQGSFLSCDEMWKTVCSVSWVILQAANQKQNSNVQK